MLQFLFWFFIVVVFIQFIYYCFIFRKFSFLKLKNKYSQNVPISVIICAKNEEQNIKKIIPLLVNQNYDNFEIVLIDDASSDETLEVFEDFAKRYNNIKIVKVQNNEAFWGNKKFALTLGIKAAKNDYLLFTDANCYPNSKNWITEMSAHFDEDKTIVLGFRGYEKVKGSFLNKLIRFENLLSALYYFSWSKIKKPYSGNGKNLAYKKSEFFKTNGFINHIKIRSGHDTLFINEAADLRNTAICISPDSFIFSGAKNTFSSWYMQQRKKFETAKHYKLFDKLQLALFFLTQILVIILSIILISWQFQWHIVVGLLVFRYLFSWIIIAKTAIKFNEQRLMYWFPVIEISLLFIQFTIFISNLSSKPARWK